MAEERIDIVVTERGSRVVKRNLDDIGTSSRKSGDSVEFLKRALATVGGAAIVRQLVRVIDSYNQLQNALKIAGVATDQLTNSTDRLLSIANRTRQDLGSVGTLYQRLAGASKDLGASQEQLYQFVEAVGAALAVNNTEANTASGVLLQLSQAMGGAKLQAQEFNSIVDGARPLLVAAAAHIDAAGGSVSRLKRAVNEGNVTAKEFFGAVLKGAPDLLKQLDSAQTLVGQSLVLLNNQFTVWLGRSAAGQAINKALAETFLFIGENLDTIAKAVLAVVAGFGLWAGVPTLINAVTASVLRLWAAFGPIGLIAVAVTSAVTALALFSDEIDLGIDSVTTLADLGTALATKLSAAFGALAAYAEEAFGPMFTLLSDWIGSIDFSVAGALRFVGSGVDTFVGLWAAAINGVIELFRRLPGVIGDLTVQALNFVSSYVEDFINGTADLINSLAEFSGLESRLGQVDLTLTNENEGAAKAYGGQLADAVVSGFEGVTFASDFVEGLLKDAQAVAVQRTAAAAKPAPTAPEAPAPTATDTTDLQKDLDKLVGAFDRVAAAQKAYDEGVKVLDQSQAAGLITGERRAQLLTLMSEQMRDALDPIGALNRQLEEETRLLGLTTREREVEARMLDIQQDLVRKGIALNDAELVQLRERLTLLQQLNEVEAVKASIMEGITGAQEELNAKQAAYNQLLGSGDITPEQYAMGMRELANAQRELNFELGQATFADGFMLQLDTMLQGVENFTGESGKMFGDFFTTVTDGFADSAARAIVFGESFEAAFGRIAEQALTSLISGLIKLGIQYMLNAALGQTAATAATAASVAQATAVATAWAPAAAMASLASFGANAAPAQVGIATTTALAQAMAALPGFAFGGDFEVGGVGGTDSQLVAFRATPGEKVNVSTPSQDRAANQGNAGGVQSVGLNVVNVVDPSLVESYLNSPEGETAILNTIGRNPSEVKRQLDLTDR